MLGRSPALTVGFQLMKSNEEDRFEPKRDAQIEIALKAASGELTAEEAEQALAERGLKGTLGSTIQYALEATRNPYWPIGLCISWILTRELDAAAKRYARHRLWTEGWSADGWSDTLKALVRRLATGELEAVGLGCGDDQRAPIPALAWLDLRIVQRGPYDEVRRSNGAEAYRDVKLLAQRVCELWPAMTRARESAATKRKAETQCLEALKRRMQADPDHPIPKAKLRPEWPDVSQRTFDRLHGQAARDAADRAARAPRARAGAHRRQA